MAVTLRRSLQETVLWDLHVMLEQTNEPSAFIDTVLAHFGVAPEVRPTVLGPLMERMPRDLDDLDMRDFLGWLEAMLPITWIDDELALQCTRRDALVEAFTTVLQRVARPSSPRVVAGELVRTVHALIPEAAERCQAGELEAALIELLERELWRCDGREAELAERMGHELARYARLRFA